MEYDCLVTLQVNTQTSVQSVVDIFTLNSKFVIHIDPEPPATNTDEEVYISMCLLGLKKVAASMDISRFLLSNHGYHEEKKKQKIESICHLLEEDNVILGD